MNETVQPAIEVESLSKRYQIGGARHKYRTLREAIVDGLAEPFRRIRRFGQSSVGEQDAIWALRDVSFAVQPGEVIGVIGRNGAGKSTLLKILSEITYPTEGRVTIRGRVASLLEVGTGFHQELTGRENVYLNGAILGMRRAEIDSKFDDIVAFSEIGKFMDTPVKRYSSGMHVRLAFSVAAHLEPEILLIDEVLAVGDVAFRRKCIGKMSDVAHGGRTVFFVSHNMAAVESLCAKTMLLEEGRLVAFGPTEEIMGQYLGSMVGAAGEVDLIQHAGRAPNAEAVLKQLRILNQRGEASGSAGLGETITFEMSGEANRRLSCAALAVRINKPTGQRIATGHSRYQYPEEITLDGSFRVRCSLNQCRLMPGPYTLMLVVTDVNGMVDMIDGIPFEVTPKDIYGTGRILPARTGAIVPEIEWTIENGVPGS